MAYVEGGRGRRNKSGILEEVLGCGRNSWALLERRSPMLCLTLRWERRSPMPLEAKERSTSY